MEPIGRHLPQLDSLLARAEAEGFGTWPRLLVKRALAALLDRQRAKVRSGTFCADDDYFSPQRLAGCLRDELAVLSTPSFTPVINATGTVIHTNLGRAPLSAGIIAEITPALCRYSDLEMDRATGKRGSRQTHLTPRLFGAAGILAVNNNAAACMLVLNTFASGREVIVSRGELVEIGGSFRIPEIMEQAGAVLREVGTTNKTRLADYERAITDRTGLILKVHRSNFVTKGFIEEVSSRALAGLGKKRGIPFFHDAGSGATRLLKLAVHGEPVIEDEVSNGADIVSFSGDKLLGGTQSGIILAAPERIDAMRRNPLYRAIRPDKFTLYYLERLFHHLAAGDLAKSPVLAVLAAGEDEIERRAKRLFRRLARTVPKGALTLERDVSAPGGGSLPEVFLPTRVLVLRHPSLSDEEVRRFFLEVDPPVIVRQKEGACLLDFRTIGDGDLADLHRLITALFIR